MPAETAVKSPWSLAIQARPVVVALSILRIYPLVDAAVKITGVSLALAESMSPLAAKTVG